MAIRILHCGRSVENYYKCIAERVAGFKVSSPTVEDIIYLVVRVGTNSLCGARGTLGEPTTKRPWRDGFNYSNCRNLERIEFCEPVNINILAPIGGIHWAVRYLQASKAIKDPKAVALLETTFNARKRGNLERFIV